MQRWKIANSTNTSTCNVNVNKLEKVNANELKVSICIAREMLHNHIWGEMWAFIDSHEFHFFRNSVEIILPNQNAGGMFLSQGGLVGLSSVARSQRFVIIHFYYLRSTRNAFPQFQRLTKWSWLIFLYRWNEATLEERPEKVVGKVFVQSFQGNSRRDRPLSC